MFYNTNDISINELNKFENLEFYQKNYYLELEAKALQGEAVYYKSEDENDIFLMPLIKRHLEKDLFDLVSPYGYPGFICNNFSPQYIEKKIAEFDVFCKNNQIITSFIRLHPANNYIFSENDRLFQLLHGKIVFFSLNKKYDDLYGNYSSNHKRGIKKLQKQGFRIKIGNAEDIDSFMKIYNQTMDRLEAKEYYYFNKEYYQELMENEKCDLIFIESPDGTLCSSALFLFSQKFIQYHLGGTLNEFLKDAPIKMIFDHIINQYSENDLKINLGGGLGGNEDNLFRFKEGFSDQKIKFSTLRIIHDQEKYNNLTSNYSKEERNDLSGFFPLYRK